MRVLQVWEECGTSALRWQWACCKRPVLGEMRSPLAADGASAVESEMDRMMTEFRAQLREESRGEAQPPVRGNSNAPARPPQYPPRAAQQLPVDDGLASARFRHSNRGASSISFAG